MNILVSPIAVKINPYIESFYCALKNTNSFIKIYPFRLKFFLKSIDLCHFHWPEAFLNAPSLYKRIRGLFLLYFKIKLLKVLKVKIVWTVHNFRPHEKYGDTTLEALFYKFWLKNVDALIFLSRASQKNFFINYSTEIESVVIPHGHYQDTFKAIVPSSYLKNLFSIEENDFVFGHYGLIRRYKNIPKLIKEFKKLSGDNYKLIVAGSVHKADENLKKEVESSIENLNKALKEEDVEQIKEKTSELSSNLMKLGEVAYKDSNNNQNTENNSTDNADKKENKEEVVDADFEEVKPDDDKKNAS